MGYNEEEEITKLFPGCKSEFIANDVSEDEIDQVVPTRNDSAVIVDDENSLDVIVLYVN